MNLNAAEPKGDGADPDGFRVLMARFGHEVGAESTGASLYELPPGEAVSPYHYEHSEEEWLLVLEGRPTLRHPDGTDRLEPWDLVFFTTGPEGAHQVRNEGDAPARVLMFSNRTPQAITIYPDSDKVGVWTADKADEGVFRRSDAVDYYEGEA